MSLTLEIVGPQATQLGDAARKTFLQEGGSIGRASVNDWVIPDAYVSGQHARVHFKEGRYFLEDVSTNGVFIKNPGNRLPRGQQYPLQSGDRVFIDAYEIKVTILNDNELPVASNPPSMFDASKQHSVVATAAIEKPKNFNASYENSINGIPVDLTIPLPEPSDAIVDPAALDKVADFGLDAVLDSAASGVMSVDFDLFGGDPELAAPAAEAMFASALAASSPPPQLSKSTKPAKKIAAKNSLPPSRDSSPSMPTRPPVDVQAMLASAGLGDAGVNPEIAENLGRILPVVIAGVMEILQAREKTKTEFGIRNTSYKKADNNPLKFSVNVEDALHNLLVKRNAAYLGPVEAFEDAFRDIQFHELATLDAVRAAFNAMLQSFSPDTLQVNFNKDVKQGGIWSGPIKLRYWDLYRERYKQLTKNPDQCFRDLFADEFVRTYSAQLEKLKLSKSK